ncbi:MAG: M1 family metallopeptidase, partial [Ginsengibacter sp.]
DTVFKHLKGGAPAFIKVGIAELASYAKVKLQPAGDINKNYMQFFISAMAPLNQTEKEMFVGSRLGNLSAAATLFENELARVKALPSLGDTSLYNLFKGYVYRQFNNVTRQQLASYINENIKTKFTKADTLRGSINAERAWWNVLHYDITVKPDYPNKTISGKNILQYEVTSDSYPAFMQVDLQEPLVIDSVQFNASRKLNFTKEGNAWHINVPKQKKSSINSVVVFYHGKVHEATMPPWDGGWIWAKDSVGNPWMSAACQGLGASIWYPCKDHQSDEPDKGASITMIVPDTLVGVANGRLQLKHNNNDGTVSYTWAVVNPINNYEIIPYIGKYENFSDIYNGSKGKLDVNYWVLGYNVQRAKAHMVPNVNNMLKAFEYWYGPYPFYEDGYKLIDAPHLGMEHQSAVAYGNQYMNGYLGQDYSGSGWGLKFDELIVHESGHEWFGNNITTNDIADMWVHEGFTMYSEALFTDYWYGNKAGNEYMSGSMQNIGNAFPVIGFYLVNDDLGLGRGGDMYNKGGSMLHSIRHSMDNDTLFRDILRGLNKTFYHKTVTSLQVENFISKQAGYDYTKVFNQYLRNIDIPRFEFYFSSDKKFVTYRYTNCIAGFDLPLVLKDENSKLKILPSSSWKTRPINEKEAQLFNAAEIEKMYYISVKQLSKK